MARLLIERDKELLWLIIKSGKTALIYNYNGFLIVTRTPILNRHPVFVIKPKLKS